MASSLDMKRFWNWINTCKCNRYSKAETYYYFSKCCVLPPGSWNL